MSALATAILNGLSGGFKGYTQAKRDNRLNARLDKKDAREEDLYQRQLKAFDRADTNFERKDAYRRDSIKAFEDSTLSFPEDNEGNRAVGPAFKGQSDKGKYLRSMRALAGQSGDATEMGRIDKLTKLARQEGFNELYLGIKTGNLNAAINQFNKVGNFKISENATLGKDRIEWADASGQKKHLLLSDIVKFGGGKAKEKKGLMPFKKDEGLIDQNTNKILREPSVDKLKMKDVFIDKNGNPRSSDNLMKQFELDNPPRGDSELGLMSKEERDAYYKSRQGAYSKWANKRLESEVDGGAGRNRAAEITKRRAVIDQAFLDSGDVETYSKTMGIPLDVAKQVYQQLRAASGRDEPSPMATRFAKQLAPDLRPSNEVATGKRNNERAANYQLARDFTRDFSGEMPTVDQLRDGLEIAMSQKDAMLVKKIQFVLKELEGATQ